jgi:hypothetical protein
MGYRSDVAILMYGNKADCEMVCNLFEQSLDDEGLRKMFMDCKKVHTDNRNEHYILWEIQDVKWYEDCQVAREKLFGLVRELEANAEQNKERNNLAIEFARIGEETDDVEWDGSDYHNYEINIQRMIDIPNFNWTEGE